MESVDELIQKEWTSQYMNDKKITAKKFRAFNRPYFENRIANNTANNKQNTTGISDLILNKIYEIHNFTKKLKPDNIIQEDQKKIKELNELIAYINCDYNDAFDRYVEKQKDLSLIDLKNIKEEHIFKLHNNFYRQHTMSRINFLITDMNSTIAYFEQQRKTKKNKEFNPELKKIKTQYNNIYFLIKDLRGQKEIEDHEIKQLENKERFISENVSEILDIIKHEEKIEKRKKRFSIVRKGISMLAIIAALWQIGNFSYYNREQIKEYYDNRVKPGLYQLKENTIDKLIYKQE